MTEVLGWTADDSACGHYRMIWPFQVLRTEGLRARQTRELTGEAMLEADLTIVQRVSTVEATQLVELVAKEGGRLAYECDDLLWALDPSNAAYSQFNDRHVQRRIARAVESCAAVIVSTAELAHEFMERWDLPTYVLPNCVPDYMARIAPRGHTGSVSSPVIESDDMDQRFRCCMKGESVDDDAAEKGLKNGGGGGDSGRGADEADSTPRTP